MGGINAPGSRCPSTYPEQERLGLGASFLGPVQLPFTLPAATDTRFRDAFPGSASTRPRLSHLCSKATNRRGSRMFSSGSHVLYLRRKARGYTEEAAADARRARRQRVSRVATICTVPPLVRPSVRAGRAVPAGLTWGTSPSTSPGTRRDPACHHKQRNYFGARRATARSSAQRRAAARRGRVRALRTFRILRLMRDSAANTLSPTADSSMLAAARPARSPPDANVSGADTLSSRGRAEFPADHNTPEQNARQSNFLRRC